MAPTLEEEIREGLKEESLDRVLLGIKARLRDWLQETDEAGNLAPPLLEPLDASVHVCVREQASHQNSLPATTSNTGNANRNNSSDENDTNDDENGTYGATNINSCSATTDHTIPCISTIRSIPILSNSHPTPPLTLSNSLLSNSMVLFQSPLPVSEPPPPSTHSPLPLRSLP